MPVGESRLDLLREQLMTIVEELADVSIDLLREATQTSGAMDPSEHAAAVNLEGRVTKARRSVEKAVAILDWSTSPSE
jgi:hypothetical protein